MIILFPLLLPWGKVRGLQRKERWEAKQMNPQPGGERMAADVGGELSCQQKSDALDCSEESMQVFPNPGALT